MPRAIIAPDEHYHVFNRGVNKQNIFLDKMDHARMIIVLLLAQSPQPLYNVTRSTKEFIKKEKFVLPDLSIVKNIQSRAVELVAFALMPNHFHLIVKELDEGGISTYLQRIEISYTKYFNTKYRRSGYLLQGPFQSVHIDSNEQLLHLSAYIHKNPAELLAWKNKERFYPWSSYQDFIGDNRWGELLAAEVIRRQFDSPQEYLNFVKTSGAKEKFDQEIYIDSTDQTS